MTASRAGWEHQGPVIGVFHDREDAEQAIRELLDAGFSRDTIGVATRDRDVQGRVLEETGTKSAEGAAAGAVSGGVLGGILGLLVGVGALAIPGIGPVIAGGALASAFGVAGGTAVAGAGIGAATGGILGALVGLGIPEEEARHFEQRFHEGGILVTVSAGARATEARRILERHRADLGPAWATPPVGAGEYTADVEAGGQWLGERDRRRAEVPGRRRTDFQAARVGRRG